MGYESNFPATKKELKKWELKALTAVGIYIDGQAVKFAPVDTGNLRSSIKYTVDEKQHSTSIGTNVDYAVYVEKGTAHARAQPFLTPAAENNIKEIEAIVRKVKFAHGVD